MQEIMKAQANSEQTLVEHTLKVCLVGVQLIYDMEISYEEKFKVSHAVLWACILHDIGKVTGFFQDYVNSDDYRTFKNVADAEAARFHEPKFPFHNELSYFFKKNYVSLGSKALDEAVEYAIYWHHPANCDDKGQLKYPSNDKLKEALERSSFDLQEFEKNGKAFIEAVKKYLGNLKSIDSDLFDNFTYNFSASSKTFPRFYEPVENEMDLYRSVESNCLQKLTLSILIEADRRVNGFPKTHVPVLDLELKSLDDDDVITALTKKNTSVLNTNNDEIKFETVLKYLKLSSNQKLFITAPKSQIATLFHKIVDALPIVYSNWKGISVEAFHSGEQILRHNTKEDAHPLNSHINILTIDRILSPSFYSDRSEEFLSVVESNLIIYDFDTLVNQPAMIQVLKELLYTKKVTKPTKNLLISKTYEPALCSFLGIRSRDIHEFTYCHGESSTYLFVETNEKFSLSDAIVLRQDTLVSTSTVEEAQQLYIDDCYDQKHILHHNFTQNDKNKNIKGITSKFGQDTFESYDIVYSVRMVNNLDVSFTNAYITSSFPNQTMQLASKVNSFAGKDNGEVVFSLLPKERIKSLHAKNVLGHASTVLRWTNHLRKILATPLYCSPIEAYDKIYKSFWTPENIKVEFDYITSRIMDSLNKGLCYYFPRRLSSKAAKKESKKGGKAIHYYSSLFRGNSYLITACVLDSQLNKCNQLAQDDLLTNSMEWENKAYHTWTRLAAKHKEVNCDESFKFNAFKQNFGYSAEFPLIVSHLNDEVESKILRNHKDTARLYRYYHPDLGLISKSFFHKLLKKVK